MSDTAKIKAPTCEQLDGEDGVRSVQRKSDDSWRHGSRITEVFERASDGTFWRASYDRSADGETHGLRSGDATISRVWPHEVKAIEYRTSPVSATPTGEQQP